LGAGDRVLTTPISAFATNPCRDAVVCPSSSIPGLLDLERCHALRAHRTIRLLVRVHSYGHSADLDTLQSPSEEFDLTILEDCAKAIGARRNGRDVGSVGKAASVSFYPTKNLGALGDGGALLTADPKIDEHTRGLRHYGQSSTYVHDEFGMNSRLGEIQAAIFAHVFLPRLSGWTVRRRKIANEYRQRIQTPEVVLPKVASESESSSEPAMNRWLGA